MTDLTTITTRIAEIDARLNEIAPYRRTRFDIAPKHRSEVYKLEAEKRPLRKEQIKLEKAAVEQTRKLLETTLEPAKQAAVKRAGDQARVYAERLLAELASFNWNLNEAAPKPDRPQRGFKSTPAQEAASARRQSFLQFVHWDTKRNIEDSVAHGRSEYYVNHAQFGWVARDQGFVNNYIQQVEEETAASFAGYIAKMARKVGSGATECSYEGHLWRFSLITIVTPAGRQVWKTQQILNWSVLGNPYNQWPSRKVEG